MHSLHNKLFRNYKDWCESMRIAPCFMPHPPANDDGYGGSGGSDKLEVSACVPFVSKRHSEQTRFPPNTRSGIAGGPRICSCDLFAVFFFLLLLPFVPRTNRVAISPQLAAKARRYHCCPKQWPRMSYPSV